MKLTQTQNMKATKSGMTLLELTVVILVLLSLISILFIGARAWKRGSDRAASVLVIRNTQQAVRSFANMNGLNPLDGAAEIAAKGLTTLPGEVFGGGRFIENNPISGNHPAGSAYSFAYVSGGEVIPDLGDLYIETTGGSEPTYFMPDPSTTSDW